MHGIHFVPDPLPVALPTLADPQTLCVLQLYFPLSE